MELTNDIPPKTLKSIAKLWNSQHYINPNMKYDDLLDVLNQVIYIDKKANLKVKKRKIELGNLAPKAK